MTDLDITEGLAKGDANVFDFLHRKYGPALLGYVLKNNGTQADAEELIHTTLLKIWENINKGSYQMTSRFEAYFFTIATNLWIDELRRRKRQRTDTLDNWQIPDDNDADLSLKKATDRRLTALFTVLESWTDTVCKALIEAFHLDNTSLLDIATQYEWDYNNTRKRIFDCRKKLARLSQTSIKKAENDTEF
jgi:RNA polymerase sigma factor (sigma-70 family)